MAAAEKQHRSTTVKHYRGVLHRLGSWFKACEEDDDEERQHYAEIAKEFVDERGSTKYTIDPVRLHAAGMEPFFEFVRSQTQLSDEDGDALPVKFATIAGYRAAVSFAFAEAGLKHLLDDSYAERMQVEFQQLRTLANSSSKAQPAMLASTLELLSNRWIVSPKRKHRFARAFLLVQWNTCSSSSQTSSIDLTSLAWNGESCFVGGQLKHRIFANPKKPLLCPILAITLSLLEWDHSSTALFPGSSQDARFSNVLRDFVKSDAVVMAALERLPPHNQVPNPRSIRNGAALVACGLQDSDVQPRVAFEKYQKNQQRGNGSFGRLLTGLTASDPEYSQSPPSLPTNNPAVQALLQGCFSPRLLAIPTLVPLLGVGLALVARHRESLAIMLPNTHPALSLPIFSDRVAAELLEELLVSPSSSELSPDRVEEANCVAAAAAAAAEAAERALSEANAGYEHAGLALLAGENGSGMNLEETLASRLPDALALAQPLLQPLTHRARALQAERAHLQASLTNVLVSRLSTGVNKVLEDRGAPPVPPRDFSATISSAVSKCLDDHVARLLSSDSSQYLRDFQARADRERENVNDTIPPPVSYHAQALLDSCNSEYVVREEGRFFARPDGRYLRVPAGFKLPRASMREAWLYWHLGDSVSGVMAFRKFSRHDLARNKPLQSSYSEWRKVLGAAERYLKLEGKLVSDPSRDQVIQMFTDATPFVDLLCERVVQQAGGNARRPSTILALSHRLRVLSDDAVEQARAEIRSRQ